jgi:ATP-dependent protease ClpP protease subunit
MILSVNQNTLTAYGIIWRGNGMDFVSALTQMEGLYSNITIKLHTDGGSVFDGNLIHNAIKNSKAKITLQIVGIAASMGAVIALSCDEVYMVENGYMMIHEASGGTEGTALDHENNAKLLRSINSNFLKKLIKKTGKAESYVKKWLTTGDNWFDADQALQEGLITGIIDAETDIEAINPQQLGVTETYNRFSALLIPKNTTQINLDNNMKKPIIDALALTGVTEQSSDTAVIEAVKKHYEAKEAQIQAKLDAEKALRIAAEKKVTDQHTADVTALIATAKKEGKITVDQEATYVAIADKSGIEALKTVLGAIPARKPIAGQFQNNGKTEETVVGRENWDWDKWQKEDPKGLEALSKETPEIFQALYNQKYKK